MKKNADKSVESLKDETLEDKMDSAYTAFDNEIYDEAWALFLEVHKSKKANSKLKGEASYMLSEIMKEVDSESEFIHNLMKNELGLKKLAIAKPLTPEYTRKYLGRKYLKASADYDYTKGLIEYGLSCVDCGEKKNFNYKYNDENAEVALAWADKMLRYNDESVKLAAYIIYTKYYFVKCRSSNDAMYINLYGDNILSAKDIDEDDQYVEYFLGHLYANPKFKDYKEGECYNPKKGYELFCEVVAYASDELLRSSAKEIKNMLETKYPTLIGKETNESA